MLEERLASLSHSLEEASVDKRKQDQLVTTMGKELVNEEKFVVVSQGY